jgi:hypothetical protein
MPVSLNKKRGSNDRCSPGGPVISASLCAVVEGGTIVGWTKNSWFLVQDVQLDGSIASIDLTPTRVSLNAKYFDEKAADAGVVGINSVIAKRRVQEQSTGNLPQNLRDAAFERACVQILDKLQGHSVVGVLLLKQ